MQYQYVIGMDISKHSFDMAILSANSPEDIFHSAFSNDAKGFEEMMNFINEMMPEFVWKLPAYIVMRCFNFFKASKQMPG
jgi:transposase